MSGPDTKPSKEIGAEARGYMGPLMQGGMGDITTARGYLGEGAGVIRSGLPLLDTAQKFWEGVGAGGPQLTAALGVPLSQLAKQQQQAKLTADLSGTRGPASDFYRMSVPMEAAGQVSALKGQVYPQFADKLTGLAGARAGIGESLAGVGSMFGGLGTQELGAGLNAGNLSRSAYNDAMQAQAAKKQAQMGMLGTLGGAAIGGTLGNWGKIFGGGKGAGTGGLSKVGASTIVSAPNVLEGAPNLGMGGAGAGGPWRMVPGADFSGSSVGNEAVSVGKSLAPTIMPFLGASSTPGIIEMSVQTGIPVPLLRAYFGDTSSLGHGQELAKYEPRRAT